MLSFITLHLKGWKEQSYVTLDGVSEHAMIQQLKLNPHLKNIVLCLDHDEAGIEAIGRLKDILTDQGYTVISVMQSQYKDWNEDLKAKYGIKPILGSEHPKLMLLPKVCGEFFTIYESLKNIKDPDALAQEYYSRLKPLIAPGKLAAVNAESVISHLQCIAAAALLSAQHQYRQMERPVSIEQLIEELQNSYRPHQDRGWLRSKAEDIRLDLEDISREVHSVGIRSREEKHNLICSYMRLALDCVKAQLFVELEVPSLLPVQGQTANFIMTM
jgi:hypothetical protein